MIDCKKSVMVLLFMGVFSGSALAADSNTLEDEKRVIQQQLQKIIPNPSAAQIKPSALAGVYEVLIGSQIIYISADGKYALNGSLLNLDTRENLTDIAKANARKAALAEIPESSMILYPAKGKQKHVVTVFTDIDCPYCHKLHKEIPAMNEAGVTVRYMAFPRSGPGKPSYFKAVSAWCADDPAKAMDQAMSGKNIPTKQCDNPVDMHLQKAEFFGVNGTPNLLLDSGDIIPGYIPAKELIQILNQ